MTALLAIIAVLMAVVVALLAQIARAIGRADRGAALGLDISDTTPIRVSRDD